MPDDLADPTAWLGRTVLASDGAPVGELDDVFTTGAGAASFGIVEVGGRLGVGVRLVAVPLDGVRHEGDSVVLPYGQRAIWDGPEIEPGTREFTPAEQAHVRAHFGADATRTMPAVGDAVGQDAAALETTDETVEVTVSEERLVVDKRNEPAARVWLRKVIVSEDVTVTVTVRREELEIVREAIEPEHAAGTTGASDARLAEGELEFVLLAEEPVVSTRVVPVERVRVSKESVSEDLEITESLRRERVTVDDPTIPTPEESP